MTNPLQDYFRQALNRRRIHIEQLRLVREKELGKETQRKLEKKIAYEKQQLDVISEIWDVG
jgi:hypothetical protein